VLENYIKYDLIDSKENLVASLSELDGFPLSTTITEFLCDVIMKPKTIKPRKTSVTFLRMEMICVYIPAYTEALARFSALSSDERGLGLTPRDLAINEVFGKIMKARNIDPKRIESLMKEAKDFAESCGLHSYLEKAQAADEGEREDLVLDFITDIGNLPT
jgi:hypothetical protein